MKGCIWKSSSARSRMYPARWSCIRSAHICRKPAKQLPSRFWVSSLPLNAHSNTHLRPFVCSSFSLSNLHPVRVNALALLARLHFHQSFPPNWARLHTRGSDRSFLRPHDCESSCSWKRQDGGSAHVAQGTGWVPRRWCIHQCRIFKNVGRQYILYQRGSGDGVHSCSLHHYFRSHITRKLIN